VLEALLVAAVVLAAITSVWRRLQPWAIHYGPLFAGGIALLTLWDLITLKFAWLKLPYFPGPDAVLRALVDDRQLLFESTSYSLRLLLTGYAVGVGMGLMTGIVLGWFRRARYWGMPLLKLLGPIPATALIPLSMIVFSSTFYSAASLIAWAVFFPVTMLTTSGIANVPASYFDVARTLGAGRRYLIFRVAIPAALSNIFIGLFIGLMVAFLTLIVAEFGAKSGLGIYLKWQQGYVEYAKVYAAIVIIAIFCSGLMTLLFKVRDWLLGWQKGVIRW
jgi:NitT/TauT family transport system permease protein